MQLGKVPEKKPCLGLLGPLGLCPQAHFYSVPGSLLRAASQALLTRQPPPSGSPNLLFLIVVPLKMPLKPQEL